MLALKFVARDGDRTRLRPAFWLLFVLLGTGLAVVAPGGAIFFIGPPLIAGLGMIAARWRPWIERARPRAALLLLYLTFGVALGLFEELMNNGPHWMFAPLGTLVLLPVLIELRPLIARIEGRVLTAGAAGLFLIGWTAVALTPAYSADRQQLFGIEYVWDADAQSGRWAVNNDGASVPYDADWSRAELPYSTRRRWVSAAPALPVAPPGLTIIGRGEAGGIRHLRLRLATNGAEAVTLIAPAESRLTFLAGPGGRMNAGGGARHLPLHRPQLRRRDTGGADRERRARADHDRRQPVRPACTGRAARRRTARDGTAAIWRGFDDRAGKASALGAGKIG